jgi:hypothetical protein
MVHAGPSGPRYSRRFRWFVSGGFGWSRKGAQEGVRGMDESHEALATFLAAQEPRGRPVVEDVCSWVVVGGTVLQYVGRVAESTAMYTVGDVVRARTVCDGVVCLEGVSRGDLEGSALVVSVAPSSARVGERGWVACVGGCEVMMEGREGVV